MVLKVRQVRLLTALLFSWPKAQLPKEISPLSRFVSTRYYLLADAEAKIQSNLAPT